MIKCNYNQLSMDKTQYKEITQYSASTIHITISFIIVPFHYQLYTIGDFKIYNGVR